MQLNTLTGAVSLEPPKPQATLVRVLESSKLTHLHGQIGRLERQASGLVQFTLGCTENGSSGYISEYAHVELLSADEVAQIRACDRVRHELPFGAHAISRVVRVNNGNPISNLESWTLELSSGDDQQPGATYSELAERCTLEPSDAPLGLISSS